MATPPPPRPAAAVEETVVVDAAHPLRSLVPEDALGAAVDGMQKGEVRRLLTPYNIRLMKTAGLRRVTYRTRPELGIEAWHWTDRGHWSDPARQQGYWTGDPNSRSTPDVTFGYGLPRRGNTVDQANDKGFSRLDDGDPASFWKSNPYLDTRFTGLPRNRPQWIVVSFEDPTPVDSLRILWGTPSAVRFQVQYWTGKDENEALGRWQAFAHGVGASGSDGGDQRLKLADAPTPVRFVRILLEQSSQTAPAGSQDVRDRLGYAVRELYLGVQGPDGVLVDALQHGLSKEEQTQINVSSTDPWHRAIDRDPDTEQPGLDLMFRTRLNSGKPLMVPVGAFYDTPENAAAEIAYLSRRGFPVRQAELGEEPDGQFISPEDYADLYIQTAAAIRRVAPQLALGGPSMQGASTNTWPDPQGGASWIGRLVARLKSRDALSQLQFFSFEHYAFDDVCRPIGGMLREESQLLDSQLDGAETAGVPAGIPWIISEYGFSPFSGRAMSELPSALLSADIVGHFLTRGGAAAYMFGYTPGSPANQLFPCAGYGDMMLYEADDHGRSHWPMPMYFAEKMMMRDWAAPASKRHVLLRAAAGSIDTEGRAFVTAYALKDDQGRTSLMLINRDERAAHLARIVVRDASGDHAFPSPGYQIVQYAPARYTWLDSKEASHPVKDEPPTRSPVAAGAAVNLPAMSLTVLRPAATERPPAILPARHAAAKARLRRPARHARASSTARGA